MNEIVEKDIEEILFTRKDLMHFQNSTILISGANSFIMFYLILTLLENNEQNHCQTKIIALCRNGEKARKRFSNYLDNSNLSFLIQDVRQPIEYEGNVDYCIHAASPAGIDSRQESPVDTFQTNLFGCENLLSFCRQKKIKKFMLLSSVDVYGKCQTQERLKESDIGLLDWTYKRNSYSNGKRAAETLCLLYYEQYEMPCVIVRPFQVYGPGMSLTDGRLHGDFVRQLKENNKILLKSDGTAKRSFMYLTDATCAMLDVLFYGENGEIYNICDEKSECSVYELAELYAALSETNAQVEFVYEKRDTPEVKEALSVVLGDAAKLEKLGWKSRTSLANGIERTLHFYRQMDGEE